MKCAVDVKHNYLAIRIPQILNQFPWWQDARGTAIAGSCGAYDSGVLGWKPIQQKSSS